jgi:hypothetical protein
MHLVLTSRTVELLTVIWNSLTILCCIFRRLVFCSFSDFCFYFVSKRHTTIFCLLSVFCVFLLTHNWIRTNKEVGAHFLGPGGVKYLNTGLATASRTIPCIFRCAVYIRCAVTIKKVRENGKYWVRVIHKMRVIDEKIR